MNIAARALAALVLLLLAAGAGYWAGDHQRNNAWLAKQAREVTAAHEKYEAEVKRGNEAAGHFLDELSEKENRYAELEKKFSALRARVPLVVPAPVAAGSEATGAGLKPRIDPPAPAAPGINVYLRPELSLGAVWMWNSALQGRDVPAGACGVDAQTFEACAAGSGLTTADAWDNQAVNAKSCAADRLRLDHLIDFLEGRKP